jgi:hypothetical protein
MPLHEQPMLLQHTPPVHPRLQERRIDHILEYFP